MKMFKKAVSVLITAAMIFGTAAFINEFDSAEFAIKAEAATEYKSGYYTYSVDENGNATITDVNTSISGDVIIPSSLDGYTVTIISYMSFYGCDKLTSVTIPDSITGLDTAFSWCSSLKSITVDKANKYYSSDEYGVLFNKDKSELIQYPRGNERTKYVIPDGVKHINDYAFQSCDRLVSVTIPASVISMGSFSFQGSDSLTSINVDKANKYYSSDEYGVLFNKDKTKIIQYPIGNTRTHYTIPDSVTSIGDSAFSGCDSLISVTILDSVTNIGYSAFLECDGLTSVAIPDSVTKIEEQAFQWCRLLMNITIGSGVKSIGEYAFSNTAYYNDENNWENGVLYIDNYLIKANNKISGSYKIKEGTLTVANSAFYNCSGLTSVTIPDSVISIGWAAFAGCSGLTSVTFGSGITSIGGSAFQSCNSLESVTIPYGVTSISQSAFNNCTDLTNVIIPSSVTSIDENAFSGCSVLTSIIIPSSVTSIGRHAFSDCAALTNIMLPDSVTSIGEDAFGDTGYYNDESNWENDVLYIGNHLVAAKYSASGSYIIKEGTLTVADWIFSWADITNITIPKSVKNIGLGAFYCYNLNSITVDKANKHYSNDEYGVLFNKDKTELIQYPAGNKRTDYAIPDGVKIISDYSFYYSNSLTSVTIPDSVTNIDEYAFFECFVLSDVYYTGSEEDWNNIIIGRSNYGLEGATIHYNYVLPEKPTTTAKPTTTKPTTTKPAVVPTTTKPTTTKPTTTKPSVVPTTRPTVPTTTRPASTTKPFVEEENIKKPSTSTVKYGETLILHINASNIPENAKIEWSVDGEGVTLKPSADGKTCAVTSTATGDVTITAKYTDASGVEHVSEQEIKSNASLWQKIVSFFKNLFGMNRVIEQRIKFN